MTETQKIDLLANCVAFAVGNLRLPLGVDRTPLARIDWKANFLSALEKCGYQTSSELPVNRLGVVLELPAITRGQISTTLPSPGQNNAEHLRKRQ